MKRRDDDGDRQTRSMLAGLQSPQLPSIGIRSRLLAGLG
jgi:hypothetical protein